MRFPSVVGAMLACALLVVLARKLFDRRIALAERALPRDQPVLRQVVAAGARLPAARRREPRRDAPPPSRARARNALDLGRVRDRVRGPPRDACGRRSPAPARPRGAHRAAASSESCRTACSRRSSSSAIGVPWIAQLAMRTDSETSETAWIPFPSAEAATRALLEVSGVAGLGVLLAALGLWALRRAGEQGARGVARDVGVRAVRARARHLPREADLPRPLPRDRDARVRDARCGRRDEPRRSAAGRRRGCGGSRHGRRARALVLVGRGRQLARGGLAKRRLDRDGASVARPTRSSSCPGGRTMRPSTTALDADDVSTADSIWVLHWSEEGSALPADVRRPLGFGDHVLVERLQFGWRVSAQLWRRPG